MTSVLEKVGILRKMYYRVCGALMSVYTFHLSVCEENPPPFLDNGNIIHYFIDEPGYQDHIEYVGRNVAQNS